jgi:hypothetical protein
VFENRVVKRKIGPKREEVVGGWRGLHNENLHNLYASPSVIRVITSMDEMKYEHRILNGKCEGKMPLYKGVQCYNAA